MRRRSVDGLEAARALYAPPEPITRDREPARPEPPVRVAPYTAEPILSAAEIRRRRRAREIRQAARRLEAAVDAEVRRRAER